MSPIDSSVISKRLKSYFVYSIASEWRKNASEYHVLLDAGPSPFSGAEKCEDGWQTYFSYLEKRISENIFDESFSLNQIYIPLNAYVLEQAEISRKLQGRIKREDLQIVVNLDDELCSWLKNGCKTDALRVISGGPGSGKSSFAKVFCAKVANQGLAKPIYIPLHLIDPTKDVVSEIERFVKDEALLGFNPLDPSRREEKLLVVFDGLDELASQGKVAEQVSRDFVQAVERMVERKNLGQEPIFVLLSGRELVVQANETEFRQPRQILSLLPYYVPSTDRGNYVDERELLKIDYRDEWWRRYGELTGKNYEELPQQLRSQEIDEITAQPLLNYLVALSYNRGKLNFDKQLNLNSVYADLIGAVHDRGYEKTRTYGPIRHIKQKDFVRILEEIGLAAWHSSDGRATSVKDIMTHCKHSGLDTMLSTFTEGAEAGVTKLLAAFFFRRNGQNSGDDAAFVFTHKSFGEYLTSARLIRGIEKIVIQRERRQLDADDGFDMSDALGHWANLAGPAEVTEYIGNFILREVEQRNKDEILTWHTVLCEMVSVMMERHFPMERVGSRAFVNNFRQDANASVALLIVLNACSRVCNKVAKLNFSNNNSFGTFLRRVVPQRLGPPNPPVFSALSHLDLSGQCLDLVDLWQADIDHTVWRKARLQFANFGFRKIVGVDFEDAKLNDSRFAGKSMSDSNFRGADLKDVDFQRAVFKSTIFCDANLVDADFDSATFIDCDFSRAALYRSNIDRVKSVSNCNFDGALVSSSELGIASWFEDQKQLGNALGELSVVEEKEAAKLAFRRVGSSVKEDRPKSQRRSEPNKSSLKKKPSAT